MDLLKNGSDPVRILVCRAITNAVVHEWGQFALMLKISPISALLAEQLPVSKPALQAHIFAFWFFSYTKTLFCI
jgi:hypothetical protein